jgi:transposase
VSNNLHAYKHQGKPNQDTIERTEKRIEFINSQIKEIEESIEQLINKDEKLKTKMEYPMSIPGVGLLTTVTIVAETNGFAEFTSIKQLTSYAGFDIRIEESGQWKGRSRISKRGNSHIRKALFMPALSKMRKDEKTRQFYNRLKEKKGIGKVAIVAVERKLLALMYSLWKKEEMFSTQS